MTIDQWSRSRSAQGEGSGMGGGIVAGVFAPADAMRPTLLGERWSIVTGHPLVGEIAADVLRSGGNAVDAGVAAGFASNVVQVDMCNLGGIAPILIRDPARAGVSSIAGVGTWGAEATLEAVRERFGGSLPLGGAPSIVPAAVAAWLRALSEFGTRTLGEILPPVIEVALNGFPVDDRMASALEVMSRGFRVWPTSAAVYLRDGRPLRAGDRLVQTALGALLQRFVDTERAALATGSTREEALRAVHEYFYTGEPARIIADFVTERGGFLSVADLAGFEADVAPAPSTRFEGWTVHVTPAWSQGPIVAQALGILHERGIQAIAPGSAAYLHEVVEALKFAFSERERGYADPRTATESIEVMLSPERLRALAAQITDLAAPNLPTMIAGIQAPPAGPRLPSTTAIVVEDADGMAFACSPSDTIDGAPIIPELGILCSPRGVQSRLVPGHANAVAPGTRPCVTPAAVIALDGDAATPERDRRVWSLACPGGDVIVQALTQVILEITLNRASPQSAVERPRVFGSSYPGGFHPHPSGDRTVFVEGGIGAPVIEELRRRGHAIVPWPANEFDAGGVLTVIDVVAPTGGRRLLAAGADSRRSAYAYAR